MRAQKRRTHHRMQSAQARERRWLDWAASKIAGGMPSLLDHCTDLQLFGRANIRAFDASLPPAKPWFTLTIDQPRTKRRANA